MVCPTIVSLPVALQPALKRSPRTLPHLIRSLLRWKPAGRSPQTHQSLPLLVLLQLEIRTRILTQKKKSALPVWESPLIQIQQQQLVLESLSPPQLVSKSRSPPQQELKSRSLPQLVLKSRSPPQLVLKSRSPQKKVPMKQQRQRLWSRTPRNSSSL